MFYQEVHLLRLFKDLKNPAGKVLVSKIINKGIEFSDREI